MKLAFTGDICFTGIFEKKLKEGEEIFSPEILELLKNKDYIIGNLEGPVTHFENSIKTPALKNPVDALNYLSERNIKVFNLANNHIFDFGWNGFEETQNLANNLGVLTFGAGKDLNEASKPLYLEKEGVTLAIIGCAHKEGMMAGKKKPGVFGVSNFKILKNQIAEAKKKAKYIFIVYHGGEEFTLYPMPERRKLFHKIAESGADVVIGHHSHVVQAYEVYKNTPVFYSLGNFIFDFQDHYKMSYTSKSVLLNFNISKTKLEYELYPLDVIINNSSDQFKVHLTDEIQSNKGIIRKSLRDFNNEMLKLSDFTNYNNNWNADAYRVLKEKRKKPDFNEKNKHAENSKKNIFLRIAGFVKKLNDPNYRPLITASFVQIIKNWLK